LKSEFAAERTRGTKEEKKSMTFFLEKYFSVLSVTSVAGSFSGLSKVRIMAIWKE
jgi:hypothetical protein